MARGEALFLAFLYALPTVVSFLPPSSFLAGPFAPTTVSVESKPCLLSGQGVCNRRLGIVRADADGDNDRREETRTSAKGGRVVERRQQLQHPWGFVEIEKRVKQPMEGEDEAVGQTQAEEEELAIPTGHEALKLCEWVPTHLYPALQRIPDAKISDADLDQLRQDVFGLHTFYVTKEDHTCAPLAVLFRGNLRGEFEEDAVELVNQRLQDAPGGLGDRVSLFLIDVPPPGTSGEGQSSHSNMYEPRHAYLAVPAVITPDPEVPTAGAWSVASSLASVVSSISMSYWTFTANPDFFEKFIAREDVMGALGCILPVAAGLMGIQALHELAHRLAAKRWGVKLGPPLVLPSFQLGVFGAITPLASFPSNKRALFDVAASGPIIAMLVSLCLFAVGLELTPASMPDVSDETFLSGMADSVLTTTVAATSEGVDTMPAIPVVYLEQSYLLSSISRALLPHIAFMDPSDDLLLHPLALVGLCGTIASAFNLMPVGRLDGGSALASAFGRGTALRVGNIVLVVQAILCVLTSSGLPSLFLWGMLINTVLKRLEAPPMEEVTEVDDGRRALFLGCLFLVLLTVLPYPGA